VQQRAILQTEAAECGLACLAMVTNHHGSRVDLSGLRQRFSVSLKGATLKDLMRMADEMSFGTRALRLELDRLKDLALPAILHWDLNHFVVIAAVNGGKAHILDPARGELKMPLDEVSKHFTGVALELTPTAEFKPVEARVKLRLSDLWSRTTGLKRAFVQILILSVLLQLFALAAPFFLQLVIDEAVVRFDQEFLLVLALGFGALYAINAATQLLRSWALLALGQSLAFQMAGNVVRHLMRLPADFFEKRHVGDIISRIGSVQPIQQALTRSVVEALIDGVMTLTTAAFMLLYSWKLASIAFAAAAIYAVIALGSFPFMRRRQEELIVARAKEHSFIIESVRAARAVKLFGREGERESQWRNAFADVVNAGMAAGKFEVGVAFANTLLFSLQLVVIVYFGARFILAGAMTVGMLFAFMAYRQNFADRIAGLITKGVEFRMIGLHLERLADIAHAPQEEGIAISGGGVRSVDGAIELRNASFRYGSNDPFIFENLSLAVEPGDFIAVAGPSGGGKTTLMKVLLGLLPPTSGELHVDGLPLQSFGLRAWRARCGVVMQDDHLLSGTIADNISFFDPDIEMTRVMESAAAARIHDDIMRMPMNYLSFIGDMGAALSGGQRQRLMLARALYRKPAILFLDEGTANLDEASEREIADLVAALQVTRIVVAHRPSLIARAGRVFDLIGGRLIERSAPLSELTRLSR